MDSRDKIRSYYERKGIRKKTEQTSYGSQEVQFPMKYKILFQIICSVVVVIIFNICLNFSHIEIFDKVVSTTKNLLEKNITLDELENFTNAIKNFETNIKIINGGDNKNAVYIDQELLEQINEDTYSDDLKK